VESENDKHFFEALIHYLNINLVIDEPIVVDKYTEMAGLNHSKLKNAFNTLIADIDKGDIEIERIGIVIDIDQYQELERIELINACIQSVFPCSPQLTRTKELINLNFDDLNIRLACYFTNVNGQGELESVL
jgi:hypothetical protein